MGLNSCSFTGNLGRDPVQTTDRNGNSIVKFPLAVNRAFSREGQASTDWFNVTVFGRQGDAIMQYRKQGEEVAVTGRVEINLVPRQDGLTDSEGRVVNMTFVDLTALDVQFIGQRRDNGQPQQAGPPQSAQPQQAQPAAAAAAPADDSGMPF